MKTAKSILAKSIVKLRALRGITQEQLAVASDLGTKMIHKVENQKVNPSLENLDKIAKALNVPVHVLFGGQSSTSSAAPLDYETIDKALKSVETALSSRKNLEHEIDRLTSENNLLHAQYSALLKDNEILERLSTAAPLLRALVLSLLDYESDGLSPELRDTVDKFFRELPLRASRKGQTGGKDPA